MRSITGKELAKAVERNGWRLLRIVGSHYIYGKDGVVTRLTIPMHGNRSLKPRLARHLLKMSGLSESDI